MPAPAYRMARQEHLGDFLDRAQQAGHLRWRWSHPESTAEYWISMPPTAAEVRFGTREAEQIAVAIARRLDLVWLPVPHPGGRELREETLQEMKRLRKMKKS